MRHFKIVTNLLWAENYQLQLLLSLKMQHFSIVDENKIAVSGSITRYRHMLDTRICYNNLICFDVLRVAHKALLSMHMSANKHNAHSLFSEK